jgi:hypothetical protein
MLEDSKILGAPVYDPTVKKHIGFVDMLDIVAAIVGLLDSVGDWRTHGLKVLAKYNHPPISFSGVCVLYVE